MLNSYYEAQERTQFETWACAIWRCPSDWERAIRNPSTYNSYELQAAWAAWKARAVLHEAFRQTSDDKNTNPSTETLNSYYEDKERVKFEQWARAIWRCPSDWERAIRNPSTYNTYELQAAWAAWKARAVRDVTSREIATD